MLAHEAYYVSALSAWREMAAAREKRVSVKAEKSSAKRGQAWLVYLINAYSVVISARGNMPSISCWPEKHAACNSSEKEATYQCRRMCAWRTGSQHAHAGVEASNGVKMAGRNVICGIKWRDVKAKAEKTAPAYGGWRTMLWLASSSIIIRKQ